jgi:hypothetical protein
MHVGERQARLDGDLMVETLPVLAQTLQYDVHHASLAAPSIEYCASTRRTAQLLL